MKVKISENELLHYALVGFEQQRQQIDQRIEDVHRRLNGGAGTRKHKKRRLSPEGRAAIAAASKRRWAAVHNRKKRHVSPEGRAAISAAMKKRWAQARKAANAKE